MSKTCEFDDDKMNERNEGDDMDNWGEDNDEEESGDNDSDDEEIDSDDDDNNDDDEDDSEDNESDEEETSDDETIDIHIEDEILEKFICTFHNGDYDAEIDDKLSSDRSPWHGPARPTQASYNKPDNWRERNRIGLEKVRGQLQSCIHSVSRQDKNLDLHLIHNIGYGPPLTNGEEPIVWNEAILDEHWDQLEDALSGNELVTNICGIEIKNVEMTKERLAALVSMFVSGRATNSCDGVRFINTNLCGEGIVWSSKLVDVSSNLQEFCLTHNRIDNMESARCLSRSLKSHTCINHLHLTHCDLGSSPEVLSVILQADVMSINIENNNIDSLGAVTIAEYLEGDPPICHIDLDHNCLNDDDAVLISQALKRNTNLKTIYLHSNNFTSIGVKALLTCVFDSSSLNAISESNHTLRRIDMFHNPNDKLAFCTEILIQLDCPQKIMLALQDKDSLLQYLANIPVELIPEVLAFSQQGDNQRQHKHLNIVYSTMRWWNMPMLYSYHNYVKSDTKRKRDDS
jgi:hypothetical protein